MTANRMLTKSLQLASLGLACLVANAGPAAAQLRVEAYSGEPFGVGRVTVMLEPGTDGRYWIAERDARIAYPVFSPGALHRMLGSLLGNDDASKRGTISTLFLFRGNDPLELTLNTPHEHRIRIVPEAGRTSRRERLLRSWWRDYTKVMQDQADAADSIPVLESYLTLMLSRRFGFPPPKPMDPIKEPTATWRLLAGADSLRTREMRRVMLEPTSAVADQQVPPSPTWPELPSPKIDAAPEIEPLASRAPDDCFYIRFGKFSNLLWLIHLTNDYGGDLGNMVAPRTIKEDLHKRIQQQLAVRYSFLADLLGDQVIADVGVVGRDTFLREGGLGVILEARNQFLLDAALNQERGSALLREKENGIQETTEEIAGRKVKVLATPDFRVRSYLAADDKFRYLATSRELMERMLTVIDNGQCLASDPRFQEARQHAPLQRGDTIFAYFSPKFFHTLVSPQYQIELRRRMQSTTEMLLLEAARLAGRAEGWSAPDIRELIAGGLLPEGFGQRPDGSRLEEQGDELEIRAADLEVDSLPVLDVPVTQVTAEESAWCQERLSYYRRKWSDLDPLVVSMRRESLDVAGRERLIAEASIGPIAEEQFGGLLSLLGEPAETSLCNAETTGPGDVISLEASLRGGLLLPHVPAHQMHLGVRNEVPSAEAAPEGWLQKFRWLQGVPGYLVAWPKPGFLDLLPISLPGQSLEPGFSKLPLGIWRWQDNEFSVISFQRHLVEAAPQRCRLTNGRPPAQVRLSVGDLSVSDLADWITEAEHAKARKASRANLALLDLMVNQLQLPPEYAREAAEQLLDGELRCPLSGEYEVVRTEHLTCWESVQAERLPQFRCALLQWFRGAEVRLLKANGRLTLFANLELQQKP